MILHSDADSQRHQDDPGGFETVPHPQSLLIGHLTSAYIFYIYRGHSSSADLEPMDLICHRFWTHVWRTSPISRMWPEMPFSCILEVFWGRWRPLHTSERVFEASETCSVLKKQRAVQRWMETVDSLSSLVAPEHFWTQPEDTSWYVSWSSSNGPP